MTEAQAFTEYLERLGGSRGGSALMSREELTQWPRALVQALTSQRLVVPASPAASAVYPGCEQQCTMPVHSVPCESISAPSFIVCDKRDDINRVAVSIDRIQQWQISVAPMATLLAGLLDLRAPDLDPLSAGRWEVGMLKGRKHSSHLILVADGRLALGFAGHILAVVDVLSFESGIVKLDKQTLIRLVDKPVAGAGDAESAIQRRERVRKRVESEKAKGNKSFLKAVAAEEGISVSRLKQLLVRPTKGSKARSRNSVN